jgi:CheY-like chemotaxis protein
LKLLFRQQFRRDVRDGRFAMEFAQSAQGALQRITECDKDTSLILILSDINMPGMSGLDLLPKAKAARAPGRSGHHDHRLWRRRDQA